MIPARRAFPLLTVCAALAAPAAARATIAEFSNGISAGAEPSQITTGPDGNLWFTEAGQTKIGRITPSGAVTEFSSGLSGVAGGIARGPDGGVWFTERSTKKIGRIDPATGQITEYSTGLSADADPADIAAGPDGRLWFTEGTGNRVGAINPANGQISEFSTGITSPAIPTAISSGPDGDVWFTEIQPPARIAKIVPATGQVTEYPSGQPAGGPLDITAGPDGNLWYPEAGAARIARITTAGAVAEFSLGGTAATTLPQNVAGGPDGNVWFTENVGGKVGRVKPDGTIAEIPVPNAGSGQGQALNGIAAGPDGAMWFAGPGDRISRITTNDPPALAAAAATGVGATTAHLSGTVNPNGGATGVAFQYGTTTAYGQTTPVQRAGDGFSPVAIAADLTGLAPGTVYHYRLAGLTAAGQAATADQTFRTSGTGAPAPIGATVSVRAKTYRDGTTALAITVRKVPAATTIVMTCRSASRARKANRCPFTRVKLVEKTAQPAVELARYFKHRRLAAGTRVGVTLTKPGAPGAVTRVTTRRRKRPSVQRLSA